MKIKNLLRNAFVLVLMIATSGLALALRPTERLSDQGPKLNLEAMIPHAFGDWQVDERIVPIQPPPDLQAVLDKTYDQVLSKTYVNANGARIMLSIAYGGNQHEGMNTHRPEVCYPAQGFELDSSRPDTLAVEGRTLPLKRVIAHMGPRHEPISYWLVVGDRLTEFGFQHKLTTLRYNLTGRIPDGMLVRVSSIDPNDARAFQLQDQFITAMLAAVSQPDKVRLLGAMPNS